MADVRLFDQQQREVRTSLTGYALLRDPMLNKGTAFTAEERETFALEGLLPTSIASMEGQLKRVRSNYDRYKNDLDRYVFLRSLQDRNETLFYAFVLRHLEEMAPIVYTPTVGDAVRKFSQIWRRARGLHLNAENIDRLETILKNYPGHESIRLIVATDSEGILGIGDQGLGGLGIPIGKLSLYVLGAGIHPSQCLPIVLDVGTNNRAHLNDPAYLGWRHERLPDDEYFGLMEKFVAALNRCLPGALLQWEDFSKQNAFTLLDTYRPQILSFNDDIQGTGAVTLGGTLAALKLIGAEMNQQRFVIHGAGAGGIGVARRLMAGLVRGGLTENEAKRRLYVLDSRGLILDDRSNLDDYKIPFAQPRAAIDSWTLHDPNEITLMDVVRNAKPTGLFGLSGQAGVFEESVVREMARHAERPIIFPLSNPTSNAEVVPADAIRWTEGRAVVASGSPFAPVTYSGRTHRIGQGNNVFVFPGIGLGALATGARTITDDMLTEAAYALFDAVTDDELQSGSVYPTIARLREVTLKVALAVGNEAIRSDVAPRMEGDLQTIVRQAMWTPEYYRYIPANEPDPLGMEE